jgi:hypothetical protein
MIGGDQSLWLSNLTARRLWPDESPIGKRFRIGPQTTTLFAIAFEVVGVVADAHAESLTSSPSERVYVPYWQELSFTTNWSFVIKARNRDEAVLSTRAALRTLDPELPIPMFRTMADVVSGSLAQRRFQLAVVLLFAAVGLLLAGVGIYGVVAYSVAQRTNEMGIRMALGATAGRIRALVVQQALAPLVPGLAVGTIVGIASERLVQSLLFGITPHDPMTFTGVAMVLTIVAFVASYIPARRATRIDPVAALRYE